MRIAILTWNRRRIGGTEAYLATVIHALQDGGHSIALVTEVDAPSDREPIAVGAVRDLSLAEIRPERALTDLREWQPDVLYAHGMLDPAFEASLLEVAPAVFFAHGYYGTCISGGKRFKALVARPCSRRFGWQCLVHYYPHRCGGLSPFTMASDYRRQSQRLQLLRRYAAVVTHSRHMENEFLSHGIPRQCLHRMPFCVEKARSGTVREGDRMRRIADRPFFHLVFLGRMTSEKGGDLLLEALPWIRLATKRRLRVTFAGEGNERLGWERSAAKLQKIHPDFEISFPGWLSASQRDALLDECDLLVVPSVWPEPLGLVGIEAGRRGVPAAAFAVGGIPEWLEDGVSGFLAPGDPPTAEGLAAAVAKCLQDPATVACLSRGAQAMAARHSINAHVGSLELLFGSIASVH